MAISQKIHKTATTANKIHSTAGLFKQAQSNIIQDLHIYCLFTQYPTEHNLGE